MLWGHPGNLLVIEDHRVLPPGIGAEDDESEAAGRKLVLDLPETSARHDVDGELLAYLASKAVLLALAGLDLSARELPLAGQLAVGVSTAEEILPVALDDRSCHAQMFHVKHCTRKNP